MSVCYDFCVVRLGSLRRGVILIAVFPTDGGHEASVM